MLQIKNLAAIAAIAVLCSILVIAVPSDESNAEPTYYYDFVSDVTMDDGTVMKLAFSYNDDRTGVLLSPYRMVDYDYPPQLEEQKYEGNIQIPATISNGTDSYPVIGIDMNTFLNNTSLISVVVPSSIQSFGSNAFYGCTSLTSLTFDGTSTLKTIGNGCFGGCEKLSTFDLPESVTYIGNCVFSGCASLDSVTIPKGAEVHPGFIDFDTAAHSAYLQYENHSVSFEEGSRYTFEDGLLCDWGTKEAIYIFNFGEDIVIPEGIEKVNAKPNSHVIGNRVTSVKLPSTLTTIADGAFADFFFIESITIPESVTYLGSSAFSGCGWLKEVTFEEGIQLDAILDSTFSGCTELSQIIIPESVKTIGALAFQGTAIESFTIPEGITTIPDGLFQDCAYLEEIVIPDSVTSVGSKAFGNCTSLKSISLESLENVAPDFVRGCTSLQSLTVGGDETLDREYIIQGDRLFGYTGNSKDIIIPDSVRVIGAYSFYMRGLSYIIIPDGVEVIEECAFGTGTSTSSLRLVVLGHDVQSIADDAFPSTARNITYVITSPETDTSSLPGIVMKLCTADGANNTERIATTPSSDGSVSLSIYSKISSADESNDGLEVNGTWFLNGTSLGSTDVPLVPSKSGEYVARISFSTSDGTNSASVDVDVPIYTVHVSASETNIPEGSEVSISATESGKDAEANLSYRWMAGDVELSSTGLSLTERPTADTIYTLHVTGTANGAAVDLTASVVVTVGPSATVYFDVGGIITDVTVLRDTTVPLGEIPSITVPSGCEYQWMVVGSDGGLTPWVQTGPVVSDITVRAVFQITEKSVSVEVNRSPDGSVTLIADAETGVKPDSLTYMWSTGGAEIGGGNILEVTESGTYTVLVTITYEGIQDTVSATATVRIGTGGGTSGEPDGSTTTVIENPDGSTTTTVSRPDGSSTETTVSETISDTGTLITTNVVKDDDGQGSTTENAVAMIKPSQGATITTNDIGSAVESIAGVSDEANKVVQIDTTNNDATLQTDALSVVADVGVGLSFVSSGVTINFSSATVQNVSSMAQNVNASTLVTVGQTADDPSGNLGQAAGGRPVLDVSAYLMDDDGNVLQSVHRLGNEEEVVIGPELLGGVNVDDVVVFYLNNGVLEPMTTRANADGSVSFLTTHFSYYVIGDRSMLASEPETPPYNPGWDDDDVWAPPTIVYEDSGSDDDSVKIAACCAAAVAAAIMACFIILDYRKR